MTDEEDAKGLYGAWLGWLAEVDRVRAAAVAVRNTEIAAAVRALDEDCHTEDGWYHQNDERPCSAVSRLDVLAIVERSP